MMNDAVADSYDLLIVGAGPAGLAAAAAASAFGASVLVVDENLEPGGQYYRSLPPSFRQEAPWMVKSTAARGALLDAALRNGATFLSQACVIDLEAGFRLSVHLRDERRVRWIAARTVFVATGARELILPFEGWTLPGVMTLGGAQNLYKSQGLAPGRRVVMSGSGPFLWLVSQQLIRAGVNVVAVAEATPVARSLAFGLGAWRFPGLALEGLGYWARIARSRAAFRFGSAVTCASGEGRLQRVTLSRIDARWGAVPGTEFEIEADALCVSHSLLPGTELTQLAKCEHAFDPVTGSLIPKVDDRFQTTTLGLFAAGEAIGIGGGPVAQGEGRGAAAAIAQYLGLLSEVEAWGELAASRASVAGRRSLVSKMFSAYAPGPAWSKNLAEDTLICRCEEVPLKAVRDAVALGDRTTDAVKSRTRCGMGRCQGRVCGPVLQRVMASLAASSTSDSATSGLPRPSSIRQPLKPLLVRDLINLAETGDNGTTR